LFKCLEGHQLSLQKLRDIALFKLTVMNIELIRFDEVMIKIIDHIKKNKLPPQLKKPRRRISIQRNIEKNVRHGIDSFFEKESPYNDNMPSRVIEVQNTFVNHILRFVDSKNVTKINDLEYQPALPSPTGLRQKLTSRRELNAEHKHKRLDDIPEEIDDEIEVPVFSTNRNYVQDSKAKSSAFGREINSKYGVHEIIESESHMEEMQVADQPEALRKQIYEFNSHRNYEKMRQNIDKMDKSSDFSLPENYEPIELYNYETKYLTKEDLTTPDTMNVNIPVPSYEDLDFTSKQTKPVNKFEASIELPMESNPLSSSKEECFFMIQPLKIGTRERVYSKPNLPSLERLGSLPKKRSLSRKATIARTFLNRLSNIEGMVSSYFSMDLKSVRRILEIRASSEQIVELEEFQMCLLDYLENKDIIDLEIDQLKSTEMADNLSLYPSAKQHTSLSEPAEKIIDDYLDPVDTSVDSIDYPTDCCCIPDKMQNDVLEKTRDKPYNASNYPTSEILPEENLQRQNLSWSITFLEVPLSTNLGQIYQSAQ
jgi:hypothetical protein